MANKSYFSKKNTNYHTIAFYNLENLFDTQDDPNTLDEDFLPDSEKQWNRKRYENKIFKLGTVISNIGFSKARKSPILVGVAEVENQKVLEDLVSSKHLKNKNYGIVHYDSPDERGIDVGLLYQKEHFEVVHSESIPVLVDSQRGERDYTRDILWVTGILNNEEIHILVNHWPSRRDGAESTSYKRITAAEKNREIISKITAENSNAKIIIMGDFNDDPSSESVNTHLVQNDLFNPMEKLLTRYRGTTNYRSQWNLFDQIIFSHNFHKYEKGKHSFSSASIFDDDFLKIYKGRYKGKPFRTYAAGKYTGGYSDHFPVYIRLQLN
ncbi:endonuclease [Aquimarina sp. AD10]|uniref:Endonuclease n=1 Tax=Aquimarina aggregata TaxID=1642818 RepID=A0A162Z6P1_9FLAO|nr:MULTISPECIES: endonuclease [Aquimarina]AXT61913.1 endonuclease [Aquimarina sp. AD10]KZS39588.1 endonuclease [Aquimarina aggregata]RKN02373.1 endonuclease [Aquimarina sp. AD10]